MRYGSAGMCLLLGVLCASPAIAQVGRTPPQSKAAAVALAEQGWDHYEKRRYAEALQAFREAESTVHAPPFLLMVARCYVELGRLLDARNAYQRVVDEQLGKDAPPEFVEAQAAARKELAELEPRIPTVEFVTTGTVAGDLVLTFNGQSIAPSTPVPSDPGEYSLTVHASGRHPLTKRIRLVEGARERVRVEQAEIDAQPATARSQDQAPHRITRPAKEHGENSAEATRGARISTGTNWKTAVLIGGGTTAGLGLATGAILTTVANGRASDARRLRAEVAAEDNEGKKCPTVNPQKCAALSDAVDARIDLSNSAFWSFVAGGAVGVGTLIYGLVTMESTGPSRSVQVAPLWGPHTAGVTASGSF